MSVSNQDLRRMDVSLVVINTEDIRCPKPAKDVNVELNKVSVVADECSRRVLSKDLTEPDSVTGIDYNAVADYMKKTLPCSHGQGKAKGSHLVENPAWIEIYQNGQNGVNTDINDFMDCPEEMSAQLKEDGNVAGLSKDTYDKTEIKPNDLEEIAPSVTPPVVLLEGEDSNLQEEANSGCSTEHQHSGSCDSKGDESIDTGYDVGDMTKEHEKLPCVATSSHSDIYSCRTDVSPPINQEEGAKVDLPDEHTELRCDKEGTMVAENPPQLLTVPPRDPQNVISEMPCLEKQSNSGCDDECIGSLDVRINVDNQGQFGDKSAVMTHVQSVAETENMPNIAEEELGVKSPQEELPSTSDGKSNGHMDSDGTMDDVAVKESTDILPTAAAPHIEISEPDAPSLDQQEVETAAECMDKTFPVDGEPEIADNMGNTPEEPENRSELDTAMQVDESKDADPNHISAMDVPSTDSTNTGTARGSSELTPAYISQSTTPSQVLVLTEGSQPSNPEKHTEDECDGEVAHSLDDICDMVDAPKRNEDESPSAAIPRETDDNIDRENGMLVVENSGDAPSFLAAATVNRDSPEKKDIITMDVCDIPVEKETVDIQEEGQIRDPVKPDRSDPNMEKKCNMTEATQTTRAEMDCNDVIPASEVNNMETLPGTPTIMSDVYIQKEPGKSHKESKCEDAPIAQDNDTRPSKLRCNNIDDPEGDIAVDNIIKAPEKQDLEIAKLDTTSSHNSPSDTTKYEEVSMKRSLRKCSVKLEAIAHQGDKSMSNLLKGEKVHASHCIQEDEDRNGKCNLNGMKMSVNEDKVKQVYDILVRSRTTPEEKPNIRGFDARKLCPRVTHGTIDDAPWGIGKQTLIPNIKQNTPEYTIKLAQQCTLKECSVSLCKMPSSQTMQDIKPCPYVSPKKEDLKKRPATIVRSPLTRKQAASRRMEYKKIKQVCDTHHITQDKCDGDEIPIPQAAGRTVNMKDCSVVLLPLVSSGPKMATDCSLIGRLVEANVASTRGTSEANVPCTRGTSEANVPSTRGTSEANVPFTTGTLEANVPCTRGTSEAIVPSTRGTCNINNCNDGYKELLGEDKGICGRTRGIKGTKTRVATLRLHQECNKSSNKSDPKQFLKCPECPVVLDSEADLKVHRRIHYGERPFTCATCGLSFFHKKHLSSHVRLHLDKSRSECSICGKSFKESNRLSAHMFHVHGTERNILKSESQLKSPQYVKTHTRSHTGEKHFKCRQCGKEISRVSIPGAHSPTDSDDKSFKCLQCRKRLRRRGHLREHLWVHTGKQPLKCRHCDRMFWTASKRTVHEKTHTWNKTHKCTKCKAKFKMLYLLKAHMLIHSTEKNFECSYCDRVFRWPGYLRIHMRMHTGKKPYICGICHKSFARSNILRLHLTTHSEERPFKCSLCNKAFKRDSHLRAHAEVLPYKCPECKKGFTCSNHLKQHMAALHRNERPYKCAQCGASFAWVNILKLHMRQHAGEQLYKCSQCPAGFTENQYLMSHMRILHGKNST